MTVTDKRQDVVRYGVRKIGLSGDALGSMELMEATTNVPHPFKSSSAFFRAAAEKLGRGSEADVDYLTKPTNVLEVKFRVEPEKPGEEKELAKVMGKEFTGWRIRFSPGGEVSKGGIRVKYPLSRDDVLSLSEEMNAKLKVMDLPFGGGKGGFESREWDKKEYNEKERYAIMRAYVRAIRKELGPNKDVPAGDMNTTDSHLMFAIADENRKMVQDYSKAALTGVSVWRAGSEFSAHDALPYLYENFGLDIAVKRAGEGGKDTYSLTINGRRLLERIVKDNDLAYAIASPVVTAKPPKNGGLEIRDEATGRGSAICAMEAAKESYLKGTWKLSDEVSAEEKRRLESSREFLSQNTWELTSQSDRERMDSLYKIILKEKKVVVQGFGNSGQWPAVHLERMGCKIIGVSDTSSFIMDENGLPFQQVLAHKKSKKPLSSFEGVEHKTPDAGEEFKIPADIIIPAATGGVIRMEEARAIQRNAQLKGSDIIISESANNPTTPEASRFFVEHSSESAPGVRRVPDILANALGVTASIAECASNYMTLLSLGIPLTPEYRRHIDRTFRNLDSSGRTLREGGGEITYEQWGKLLDDRMRYSYHGARDMAERQGVDLAEGTWLVSVKRILDTKPKTT
jgi:glutamate dehydrogenase/leucine dehydrogenase